MKKNIWFVIGLFLLLTCAPNTPDQDGFDNAAYVANDVAVDNLMHWVEQLAAVRASDIPVDCEGFETTDLFPACELTRDASVKLVADAFKSMGLAPDTVLLGTGSQAAYNIQAEWRGTTRPQEVVLIASHLDAFYAGADDNASAVAAMLEAARAVQLHRFARTIRFVAFDLEEYGSVGSTRYINAGHADDVVVAIVMDMIGYASRTSGSQKDVMGIRLPDPGDYLVVIGNKFSTDLTQKMVALGNGYNLAKLLGIIAPGDGAYFLSSMFLRSDHGLLWYKGIPAVFLTDTANFRNPNYHQPTDRPETLDTNFLARNTRALVAAIALFAGVQS